MITGHVAETTDLIRKVLLLPQVKSVPYGPTGGSLQLTSGRQRRTEGGRQGGGGGGGNRREERVQLVMGGRWKSVRESGGEECIEEKLGIYVIRRTREGHSLLCSVLFKEDKQLLILFGLF